MSKEKEPKAMMDMQAMMEAYKKVGTSGDPHKVLARMAGSWTPRTKSWMGPGKAPVEISSRPPMGPAPDAFHPGPGASLRNAPRSPRHAGVAYSVPFGAAAPGGHGVFPLQSRVL
jgi:hypothetical protein